MKKFGIAVIVFMFIPILAFAQTRQTLENVLEMLGVSAPEKM